MACFSPMIIALIVIISVYCTIQAEAIRPRETYSKDAQTTSKPPRTYRGAGISAWGIVILVVSLILMGAAAYYVTIFYPILCKKQRKYDRMELSTV